MIFPIQTQFPIGRVLNIAMVLSLLGGSAGADIIPDDHKSVSSELLIEGMEQFPEMTFVLFPVHTQDTKGRQVKSGENNRFYKWVETNLYALKAGTDTADASVFEDPSVPRSDVEIRQVGTVPNSEAASFIRRVYRITGISGNHIALERQPDERFDAEGKLIGKRTVTNLASEPQSGKKYLLAGAVGLFVLMVPFFTAVRRKGRSKASADTGA
jgi:hypothetical protein